MKKVSIIIVTYNGRKWLEGCFGALANQTYKNFEVVFVDNNSRDDSADFVEATYPGTIVVRNKANSGFAGGNNVGLPYATGEYILLLSDDTIAEPTFLENLLRAFDEIPRLGCVQSKLIFMYDPTKLDSCGSYFTWTGFMKHIGNQKSAAVAEYNKPRPVFSVKGACMMFKKEILEKTGGLFDNDYWCYFEETDFCMRVWLAGYECWYYPAAAIQHAMGGTTGRFFSNAFIQYYSFRNRLMTYLKVLSSATLLRMLPAYLLMNVLVSIGFLAVLQFKNCFAIYRALWYNIINFSRIMRQRSVVQKMVRIRPDSEYLPALTKKLELMKGIYGFVVYLFTYEKRERNSIP